MNTDDTNVDKMTAEDFLAVLQEESEKRKERIEEDPDVYTTREIEKRLGLSNRKALDFIKELFVEGKGEPVFATRKDAWNRSQPNIPAIRLIMEA